MWRWNGLVRLPKLEMKMVRVWKYLASKAYHWISGYSVLTWRLCVMRAMVMRFDCHCPVMLRRKHVLESIVIKCSLHCAIAVMR